MESTLHNGFTNDKTLRLEAVTSHIDRLVWLLNHDDGLAEALGSEPAGKISAQVFMETHQQWVAATCSEVFAIVVEEAAIGVISLSHQEPVNRTARIGYWLGSSYWHKGYASQAFQLLLELAKSKGFRYVVLHPSKKHSEICT